MAQLYSILFAFSSLIDPIWPRAIMTHIPYRSASSLNPRAVGSISRSRKSPSSARPATISLQRQPHWTWMPGSFALLPATHLPTRGSRGFQMNTIGTAETDTGKIQSLRRVIRQRRANLVPAGI